MNEENIIPTTVPSDPVPEPVTEPVQTEAAASDLQVTEETEVTEAITLVDFQQGVSDICHVCLFGNFLICGTLIGLALLRKIYGT